MNILLAALIVFTMAHRAPSVDFRVMRPPQEKGQPDNQTRRLQEISRKVGPENVFRRGRDYVAPLAERLGYKATDRLLIINGDDVGMCHTANLATIDCMEHGLLTSATIMVPCPWFTEIARYAKAHPEKDFGIHLCHTSEWQTYRWGPVAAKSMVPGLVDPEGYLWRDESDVWKHSSPEQAEAEAHAQIKMAMAAGVDVTHLDSHMGALQLDPRYHEVYVKLAKEFNLPLRMG